MLRHLFRLSALVLAAPLLLVACNDNADPVKPKVASATTSAPAA